MTMGKCMSNGENERQWGAGKCKVEYIILYNLLVSFYHERQHDRYDGGYHRYP